MSHNDGAIETIGVCAGEVDQAHVMLNLLIICSDVAVTYLFDYLYVNRSVKLTRSEGENPIINLFLSSKQSIRLGFISDNAECGGCYTGVVRNVTTTHRLIPRYIVHTTQQYYYLQPKLMAQRYSVRCVTGRRSPNKHTMTSQQTMHTTWYTRTLTHLAVGCWRCVA